MFQRILVPLDGSSRAEQAIPVAAHIASASDGELMLLRVVNYPLLVSRYSEPPLNRDQVLEKDVTHAKAYLEDVIASNECLKGIETKTEVLVGVPTPAILGFAQEKQVDFIIMCSHGDTGFKRWMLGSVAQHVARHSSAPVFILREDSSLPTTQQGVGTQPLRVLVPLDGSPLAEAALTPAAHLCAALAAPTQRVLHLALVLRPRPAVQDEEGLITRIHEEDMAAAKLYLSDIEHRLQEGAFASLHLMVSTSLVTGRDIAETLINIAEHGEGVEHIDGFDTCDVIAMATHGHSGITRLIMGSNTERMLGATRCPLLIVRPQLSKAEKQAKSTEGEQKHTASATEYPNWVGLF